MVLRTRFLAGDRISVGSSSEDDDEDATITFSFFVFDGGLAFCFGFEPAHYPYLFRGVGRTVLISRSRRRRHGS